ncbi:unnamed protein product [Amoebophrya sp. A120]|nr:unnamed protein product [Amoebophrya sp. A120]|eukprot:GSA120T00002696001.1
MGVVSYFGQRTVLLAFAVANTALAVQLQFQTGETAKKTAASTLADTSFQDIMRNAMKDADDIDMDSAEYQESAAALSASLGSDWNGAEIERRADQANHALLDGIANPRQVSALTQMLGALAGGLGH